MTTYDLAAICDTCKTPIADGEGDIWVKQSDLVRYRTDLDAWNEKYPEPDEGLRFLGLRSFSEQPSHVRWRVTHNRDGCDAGISAGDYSFEVHRCRTWAQLTRWTADLIRKNWLGETDWSTLLHAVVTGEGTRITPVDRPLPQA